MDNGAEAIFIHDIKGKLLDVNLQACKNLQYTREELLSKSVKDISVTAEDGKHTGEIWSNVLAGNIINLQSTQIRKDQSEFPIEVTLSTISFDKEKLVIALVRDITKRKKAEEVLRRSEERYRELSNSLPELVFETDLTGKITYISQRATDFTGFTNEELKGRNMLEFVIPEERKRAIENMKRSLTGENLGSSEYTLFKKDGSTYPTFIRTAPIISESKVTGLRGLVIEITERKQAEEKLKESEEKYRVFTEKSPVAFFVVNSEGKYVQVNDAATKMLFYSKNELLKMSIVDILFEKDISWA